MPRRGRSPSPRGIFSFEDPTWSASPLLLVDTSVVVDALVPTAPSHAACARLFESLGDQGAKIVYNELLQTELCETLFRLALIERWGSSRWRAARYDGRARRRAGRLLEAGLQGWSELLDSVDSLAIDHSTVADQVPGLMRRHGLGSYDAVHAATAAIASVTDIATLDHAFAALPSAAMTIHTTGSRVASMRRRR